MTRIRPVSLGMWPRRPLPLGFEPGLQHLEPIAEIAIRVVVGLCPPLLTIATFDLSSTSDCSLQKHPLSSLSTLLSLTTSLPHRRPQQQHPLPGDGHQPSGRRHVHRSEQEHRAAPERVSPGKQCGWGYSIKVTTYCSANEVI